MYHLQSIAYRSSAIPRRAFTVGPITNQRDPRVHLQVAHSQFHGTTFHLVLVLFVSQLPKNGIPYRLTFCSLKHSLHLDVI